MADDWESLYISNGKSMFLFKMEVENPDPSVAGKAKYLPVKVCALEIDTFLTLQILGM